MARFAICIQKGTPFSATPPLGRRPGHSTSFMTPIDAPVGYQPFLGATTSNSPRNAVLCYSDSMSAESPVAGNPRAAVALDGLKESLSDCRKCALAEGRTQVVFGVGDPDAALMFVGEGPGFHEDKQGEPFVGQAGKLLTELLRGIGLERSDVYIANVVKCRPPENRDPAADEIAACSAHLLRQIEIIRPRVICTLGRFATKLLAETGLSITAIHGKAKEVELGGVAVLLFPVFHPAAALYTPSNRKVLEEDFAKLRVLLGMGIDSLGPREPAGQPPTQQESEQSMAPSSTTPQSAEPGSGHGNTKPSTEQLPLW
jgi:uracil-DNA glycosylase family 4